MTEAEELEWFRDWRKRLISNMNWWRKPTSYKDGCQAWTAVERVLREPVPNQQPQKGAEG